MKNMKDVKEKLIKVVKKAWPVVAMAVGVALVLTWLLMWRYFLNDWGRCWDFVFGRPRVFLFNAWLMLLIVVMFSALLGGLWRGTGFVGTVVLIVAYVNLHKFLVRGVPLLPEDLQLASEAGSLASFVSVGSLIGLIASIALLIAVVVGLAKVTKKWQMPNLKWYYRIGGTIVAALVFLGCTGFIRHNDGGRYQTVDFLETTFTAWNQTRNYDENGFLIGFLYNWSKFQMPEPEEYSEEEMEKIKAAVEDLSERQSDKVAVERPGYNIVVVLDESFIDFAKMEEYYPHSGGDVTPNLHRLMAENASGYLYSVDYGGGTANVEFETLTGLTNYWTQTVPYTSLITKLDAVPSYASWAKTNGYATTAVHAFNGGMYKRNIVLPKLGFDEFITESDYKHREMEAESEYINDAATYAEVLDVLARPEKQFVMAITMQNHTPYGGRGGDFVLDAAPSEDEGRKEAMEKYMTSLHSSDQYLGDFIAAVDALPEKTVVIFFGDHAPGLFWELDVSDKAEEVALSRMTPYFIHANFEVEDLSDGVSDKLPTTTPNCLMNTALNTLGVKKPVIGGLLDEVCAVEPILTARYIGGRNIEDKYLNYYKLLTYDILK